MALHFKLLKSALTSRAREKTFLKFSRIWSKSGLQTLTVLYESLSVINVNRTAAFEP